MWVMERRLTPAEVKEIIVLYESGVGTTELGLRYGTDHSSIYYWIRKHGAARHTKIPNMESRERVKDLRLTLDIKVIPQKRRIRYGEVFISIHGERPPKSYRQILRESKAREKKKYWEWVKAGGRALSTGARYTS